MWQESPEVANVDAYALHAKRLWWLVKENTRSGTSHIVAGMSIWRQNEIASIRSLFRFGS